MHVWFLLLFVSQLYLFNHQIKHLKNHDTQACVLCITSVNYIDVSNSGIILVDNQFVEIYTSKIGSSIPKGVPRFYSSRAPPNFT